MMAEGDGEVKREAVEAGAGRRRGGAAGPGGGGTAPLAVLCGMHCQGGCAALQTRSNSTGGLEYLRSFGLFGLWQLWQSSGPGGRVPSPAPTAPAPPSAVRSSPSPPPCG